MDDIAKLQNTHDLTLAEAFHFQRPEAARAAGRPMAAIDLLRGYLQANGRKGEFYRESLAILDELESQQLLYDDCDTPLRDAAVGGYLAVVEVLLAAGADPNARDTSGRTPLDEVVGLPVAEVLRAAAGRREWRARPYWKRTARDADA